MLQFPPPAFYPYPSFPVPQFPPAQENYSNIPDSTEKKPEVIEEEVKSSDKNSSSNPEAENKNTMKIYNVEYLLKFRGKWQKRPKDMRAIEIPLKSNLNIDFSPYDDIKRSEAAETVRNLRILLNKLAKDNFARISDTMLNNFEYNEEIVKELVRILFNKCVNEHTYIDLYMKLVDQFFIKFKQSHSKKSNSEIPLINFKKMFIEKCQETFEAISPDEFLKELPEDLDEEEKKEKKRERRLGNTKLIGQLFIRGAISDKIVDCCFKNLFEEKIVPNIENLCHLLLTIGKQLYEKFASDANQTTNPKKSRIRLKVLNKEIFDDYVDRLISLKQMDGLPSRIKFMIQDVIDAKNKDWNNAFDKFVVPVRSGIPGEEKGVIIYRKKTKSIEQPEPPVPVKKIECSPDPKLEMHEMRKKSMNEQNVFGRNLEKFQKTEIDDRIRVNFYAICSED